MVEGWVHESRIIEGEVVVSMWGGCGGGDGSGGGGENEVGRC